MREMDKPESPAGDVLDLCCGGKKCPVFTMENGGVSIQDAEKLGADSIQLTVEDVAKLREWLNKPRP